mmetsp:Transcript_41739/g.131931  ORF Transcript_41739/g.131931 Transcript_41739/m.131931 type:complete len:212 (-) Transcript_41739:64-699(-)
MDLGCRRAPLTCPEGVQGVCRAAVLALHLLRLAPFLLGVLACVETPRLSLRKGWDWRQATVPLVCLPNPVFCVSQVSGGVWPWLRAVLLVAHVAHPVLAHAAMACLLRVCELVPRVLEASCVASLLGARLRLVAGGAWVQVRSFFRGVRPKDLQQRCVLCLRAALPGTPVPGRRAPKLPRPPRLTKRARGWREAWCALSRWRIEEEICSMA